MSKEYTYKIEINFSGVNVPQSLGKISVPRYLGRGTDDTIDFKKTKIVFNALRSKKYNREQILSATNTINQQIVKSIILYYANASNFPKIKSIKCDLVQRNLTTTLVDLSGNEVVQIFDSKIDREDGAHISHDVLKEETVLGAAARVAVSRWMVALNTTNNYIRFNHLWTAFNALFAYYGNCSRECENISYIREQICAHPAYFTDTIAQVAGYNFDQLRQGFRWYLMCKNDIRRSGAPLINTILAYSDPRIVDLFRGLRQDHRIAPTIDNHQRRQDVDNKLNAPAGAVSDIEIVALICTKYAYYLRNMHQHGQVMSSAFKIQNTQVDKEFNTINKLLSRLILELLKNCDQIAVKQ